jgi:hemerythrin-like domain-containing protein
MNAIELLKQEHQEALSVLDELELAEEEMDEEETAQGLQTFTRLYGMLKLHTRLEEEVFYPALEQFNETREQVREAYREHERVDELLAQLANLAPANESFQDLLSELRDSLDQHIEEEEGELFPKAEDLCGLTRLNELGRQMEQVKRQASGNGGGRATASGKKR